MINILYDKDGDIIMNNYNDTMDFEYNNITNTNITNTNITNTNITNTNITNIKKKKKEKRLNVKK